VGLLCDCLAGQFLNGGIYNLYGFGTQRFAAARDNSLLVSNLNQFIETPAGTACPGTTPCSGRHARALCFLLAAAAFESLLAASLPRSHARSFVCVVLCAQRHLQQPPMHLPGSPKFAVSAQAIEAPPSVFDRRSLFPCCDTGWVLWQCVPTVLQQPRRCVPDQPRLHLQPGRESLS
jgi:hypothetical protein